MINCECWSSEADLVTGDDVDVVTGDDVYMVTEDDVYVVTGYYALGDGQLCT